MWHTVPFFEFGRVFQTEVGCEIDDFDLMGQQFPGMSHGDAVRRGEKDDITIVQCRFIGRGKGQIDDAAQGRKHVGDWGTLVAS